MSYVYIRCEPGLYTVGFYEPNGKWQPESDHTSEEAAADRVHWLNGGVRSYPRSLVNALRDVTNTLAMCRGETCSERDRSASLLLGLAALKEATQSTERAPA